MNKEIKVEQLRNGIMPITELSQGDIAIVVSGRWKDRVLIMGEKEIIDLNDGEIWTENKSIKVRVLQKGEQITITVK